MEIRELKAKDVRTLAKMLGKVNLASIDGLVSLVKADNKSDAITIGLSVFRIFAADLADDVYAWLADLAGKTSAELDEMPFDTPVEIVKALVKQENFASFFGQASKLAEKTGSSPSTT